MIITDKASIASVIKAGIKVGDPAYIRTDGVKDCTHAIFITKINKNKIYYSAHSNSRKDKDLQSYFDSENKDGSKKLAKFFFMKG